MITSLFWKEAACPPLAQVYARQQSHKRQRKDGLTDGDTDDKRGKTKERGNVRTHLSNIRIINTKDTTPP